DLISLGINAPQSVRAIFIDGGSLSEQQRLDGGKLGRPLITTYGKTETALQVCANDIGSCAMKVLRHVEIMIEDDLVSIKAASLFSGYAYFDQDQVWFEDPKVNGWFKSSDFGELSNGVFKWLGRRDRCVKVKGVLVNLDSLEIELIEKFPHHLK